MSRKSSIDPEVMQADRYLEQSLAAQALYPQLLMESDTMGVVVGVRRVLLASGIPNATSALDELMDNGYVVPLDIHGDTVSLIRHYFINNNYLQKYAQRSKFYERLPDYIETPRKGGEIYGALRTHSARTVHAQAEQRGEEQRGEEQRGEEMSGGERNRGGEPTRVAQSSGAIECPRCHGEAFLSGEAKNGFTQFECLHCRKVAWIDTDTGTVVDNPYNDR